MRGGDLSNEAAPSMGIRFEGCIKTGEGKLNRSGLAYLQQLGGAVDINVIIITTVGWRKAVSFLLKWGVPYNEVIHAESLLEIPDIVRAHNMMAYWDMDRDVVQNVNSRGTGKVDSKQWTLVTVL